MLFQPAIYSRMGRMVRAIFLGMIAIGALATSVAQAREVVYVIGKDGRVSSLEASNLSAISSTADLDHPDSVTALSTGNAALVYNNTSTVVVVMPELAKVSTHKYPELKTLVNVAA